MPAGETRKVHTAGTHRIVPPETTLARVTPFLPVMGITRVANVTGLDTIGIPVVMVTRPNARSVSVSQGKGVTLAAARASGVMESIETYHAERIAHPVKFASYEDLRWTHRVADVTRLPHRADGTFSPHTPILWIEGMELMSGTPMWVPFETVHLNFTVPMPPGSGAFIAGSNGLASGNHPLEAIVHAIGELVERDAATLWHLRSAAEQEDTRIDLSTVGDPLCRSMLQRFEDAGVDAAVWELTSDIGLPAFLCRIVPREDLPRHSVRPASGMGCHCAREVALARALTEAAQSRLTFISGARDDMPRGEYLRHLDPAAVARWQRRIRGGGGGRDFALCPTAPGRTVEEDLRDQLARLRRAGIDEVVAVDLTKPEFGIPVVRVVIPGLEGIADSPEYLLGDRGRAIPEHPAEGHA
ncbi:YcaO-like family protein [Azospirillum halopraeferens]|uniref:YcaO-like family protein n=1 Tax=Azospirillum halopraeferens TaxID=34010 RepID=UPI001FDEE6DE|nr:YcaO-like family protein [Azospirillum halopraeferens]